MRKLTFTSILVVVFLAASSALAQEKPPEKPPVQEAPPGDLDALTYDDDIVTESVEVDGMLKVWSQRLKRPIFIDPQISGTKIKFVRKDVPLTWGIFKQVLDFHDVVLEEKESSGRPVIFACARRNISQRVAPPTPVIGPGEQLPKREEYVTAILQIKNGAGNDIFSTVRGLLVRDVNRVGNILYVRGPEAIIVCDFVSNVEYYRKIISQLDVPSPGQVTRVFQIQHAPVAELASELHETLKPQTTLPPPTIVFDRRTNRLIVSGTLQQCEAAVRLIEELDIVPKLDMPAPTPAPPSSASAAPSPGANAPSPATPVATTAPSPPPPAPPGEHASWLWPFATLAAGVLFLRQLAITWRLYGKLGARKGGDPGPFSIG